MEECGICSIQSHKLYKDFKEALDKLYGSLKLDEKEKRQVFIQNKVAAIKNDPSSANREKTHIRDVSKKPMEFLGLKVKV